MTRATIEELAERTVPLAHTAAFLVRPALQPDPHLTALRRAGTEHVYADTADVEELASLLARETNRHSILAEIDGNTVNQPTDDLGMERMARLYRVEPELLEFLRDLRQRVHDLTLVVDGDALGEAFDRASFGDVFHRPTEEERAEMRESKLPKLDGDLEGRIPLDTHYSLLANADFAE